MTQRQAVLEMLERGPVTNAQFAAAHILRYSARIEELRAEGLHIACERLSGGTYVYTLQSPTPNGTEDRSGGKSPGPSLSGAPAAPLTCTGFRDYTDPEGVWVDKHPLPEAFRKATANRWSRETRPQSRESSENQQPADAANEFPLDGVRVSQHPDSLVIDDSEPHLAEVIA